MWSGGGAQVCFPGGMVEEGTDMNIIETSLREMEEEIGEKWVSSVSHPRASQTHPFSEIVRG